MTELEQRLAMSAERITVPKYVERARRLLSRSGARTLADLHRLLADLPAGARRRAACELAGLVGDRRSTPRLLAAVLESAKTEDDAVAASTALWSLGGARVATTIEPLLRHPRPLVRTYAAYALGFTGQPGSAPLLAERLADSSEDVEVRSYAAEALGHLCARLPAAARGAIVAGLRDSEPEVRFWSIFASTSLALGEVEADLKRLMRDHTEIAGWWPVSTEARWALFRLEGKIDEAEALHEEVSPPAKPL
ncbi:MAG: HEAT repeat domain-containing protein [Gaiellaceae bacterium]